MKITEELIKEIGFEKIPNSENPTYYILIIHGGDEVCISSYNGHWRHMRRNCGEVSLIRSLDTLRDLVNAISIGAFKQGSEKRRQTVLKALDLV